jgi:CheY-like chemotaxis protein/anti-sigma regulatory factor (Ser/Thr protein kinase)
MEVILSETKIDQILKEISSFFKSEAEQKGIALSIKNNLRDECNIVTTDQQKIFNILSNLVKNSIKFTENGFIEISCQKAGNMLEFIVKDTGVGIQPAQKGIIFERFRQGTETLSRKYEGSGLGLTISKALVEMLGGEITAKSEPGKGSEFSFTIPCQRKEDNGTSIMVRQERKKKLSLLIVEDDPASQMLVNISLKPISEKIFAAKTGLEAIEICKNNPEIDLILMDIQLPKMDGYEATREIRKFNKKVIIIAQTAYGYIEDKEKALLAGCNDYVTKPIKKERLIEIIFKYFQ